MWFDKNPENMPAMAVIPSVISDTAQVLLHPAKQTPTRQRAGTKEAAITKSFRLAAQEMKIQRKCTDSSGEFASAGRGENIFGASRIQSIAKHNPEKPHCQEWQSR